MLQMSAVQKRRMRRVNAKHRRNPLLVSRASSVRLHHYSSESSKGLTFGPPGTIPVALQPELVSARGSSTPKMVMAQTLTKDKMVVGRSSGKRTLAEVMDQDLAAKRKKYEPSDRAGQPAAHTHSKFFCTALPSPGVPPTPAKFMDDPVAGPSRLSLPDEDKENHPFVDKNDNIPMEESGPVHQEDGYVSPSPSMTRWDTPDVSSPLRAGSNKGDDFDADVLSSPPLARSRAKTLLRESSGRRSLEAFGVGRGLFRDLPAQAERGSNAAEDRGLGPDLRETLEEWDWDELTSEAGGSDTSHCSDESAPSSAGVITPDVSGEFDPNQVVIRNAAADEEDVDELEDDWGAQTTAARNERVANGWWEKWARRGPSARESRPVCFITDLSPLPRR
ncbi:hypothetical protein OBBRIDRAFT_88891 [Obba rivulosa]|uniref:Uncharacterized protein n=1 Tax=Obba rivulosa TaxID=1052685 RepID=A0A8E2AXG1_9APHY|nr:hypothetical protein OBBRIDRAFT_88891 [Obba rivulosa]